MFNLYNIFQFQYWMKVEVVSAQLKLKKCTKIWVTTNASINFVNSIKLNSFLQFVYKFQYGKNVDGGEGWGSISSAVCLSIYQECSIKRALTAAVTTNATKHWKPNWAERINQSRIKHAILQHVELENRRIVESYINIVNRENALHICAQLRCELRIAIRLWLRLRISHLASRFAIAFSISISISCSISIGRLDSWDNWWLWVSAKCRERVICMHTNIASTSPSLFPSSPHHLSPCRGLNVS